MLEWHRLYNPYIAYIAYYPALDRVQAQHGFGHATPQEEDSAVHSRNQKATLPDDR